MAIQAGGIAFCRVLGQKILSIADASVSAEIQYDHEEYFCRSHQQKRLSCMFGSGLLTEDADSWLQLHDSVNNSFARKNIIRYHAQILQCVDVNVARLESPGQGLELCLGRDTIGWSVATISSVLLGERFSDEMIAQFLAAFLKGAGGSLDPRTPGGGMHSQFTRLLRGVQLVSSELERLIDAPVQAALKQDPLQSPNLLLDINDELRRESRCPFSRFQHRNLVKTLFMVGIQTSAYTLDWLLLLLARHPDVWQQLAEAVRPQLRESAPTAEVMDQLVCVQHVIHEAMRLRPVIPTIQKGVAKSCEIAGVAVQPGDTLNLSVFGIHHSADYWDDPGSFNPDRFRYYVPPQLFTPFGLGQHTCLGQHLAMHVLATTLVRLVQRFDIVGDPAVNLDSESTFLLKPLHDQRIVLKSLC